MLWIGFLAFIAILLALDLGVFNKSVHQPSTKEALIWTGVWTSLSFIFAVGLYFIYKNPAWTPNPSYSGSEALIKYITGYLVEWSLSLDNIFVILIILQYFKIPPAYHHRVLFWGILGAVFFRGLFIAAGSFLVQQFSWINYLFGAIILFSAYKLLFGKDEAEKLEHNTTVRMLKKYFPITRSLYGQKFFIRRRGIMAITPLFVALMVIESTDIMFAFDSIPAIFAITDDPFIVFTSNLFAILGLRSLYFVLSSIIDKFKYLKISLVVILIYIGLKLIGGHHVEIPEWFSLTFIVLILGGGVFYSMFKVENEKRKTKKTNRVGL